MKILEAIQKVSKEKEQFKSSDIMRKLGHKLSRQSVAKALSLMVKRGELVRQGEGRNTFYIPQKNTKHVFKSFGRKLQNKNLNDWEILENIKTVHPDLFANGTDNANSLFSYGFLEMLNNAIEHSLSKEIKIDIFINTNYDLAFEVRDFGIGVFRNIMKKRKLKSELEAIQDLLKGKTTTAPKAHSGEGIFFTSKAADKFVLDSFGYKLTVDNLIEDVFVEESKPNIKGTSVTFVIPLKSRKSLQEIFKKYQKDPNVPAFDKTEIKIKLYTMGTIYISRSQARRVLAGLEKFRSIVLDFQNVPTIGQAFADEVFRVFKLQHPNIEIKPVNMEEGVKFMVDRTLNS